jgi:O-antigen ligase
VTLGVVLPVMLAPATKSSPLFLAIAAVLSVAAVWTEWGGGALVERFRTAALSWGGGACLALLALMAATIPLAHDPAASLHQFVQLLAVAVAGFALSLCFPDIAPRRRAVLFAAGIVLTAAIIFADLVSGLWLRGVTGGRETAYTYNRGAVTLTLLIWPAFALALSARKMWLALPILAVLPLAVFRGESGTAVLALLAGLAVFPIAFFLPRLTRWLGLAATLALLAVQPWFGSIMQVILGKSFHQRFESAHSSDRVDIWLSFEAAARAKWLFGNGFGSSLNLQNGPVAALIPPERVTLLGASHPHNAYLQLWVELGLAGAALAALLTVLIFRIIARMRPGLQPFVLTWFAVTASVALVSHGAWQAWWWAAIAASAAGFAALEHDLRRGEPPL